MLYLAAQESAGKAEWDEKKGKGIRDGGTS